MQGEIDISRTTLQRLVGALHVGPEHTMVDLGYGHGGPSLWVAQWIGGETSSASTSLPSA
jgi:cyclopropane fatty-acyl-phospholipid synthase-like methyltransferase